MFNSASPYSEGRNDGFAGHPACRGFYGAVEWAEYLAGHADGVKTHYLMFGRCDEHNPSHR